MIEEPFSMLPIDKIATRLRADIVEMMDQNQSEILHKYNLNLFSLASHILKRGQLFSAACLSSSMHSHVHLLNLSSCPRSVCGTPPTQA